MLCIGPETAGFDFHRLLVIGVGTKINRLAAAFLRLRLGNNRHSPVQPDAQQIIIRRQRGKPAIIFQVGPETSKAGLNHFTGFRMRSDIARQA